MAVELEEGIKAEALTKVFPLFFFFIFVFFFFFVFI
ncbi:hypothetical protein Pmgp_01817 [Pelotomaculum propionicicum]|uniref:Uncharacterized protein n=1 Tax=Pelotomaculum propionicicum TaxID=258475 RepID=A0A4Y7RRG6_9FIRM|nr:hypothetical protein Pmgp_01817 [Pelotomaculum propionicicum]